MLFSSWTISVIDKYCFFQGMIAGHVYYFLEDVYPRMTGRRPLKTPSFIKALFADDNVVVARPPNAGLGAGARFGAMGADPQAQ
jgi:Derlin-2/3